MIVESLRLLRTNYSVKSFYCNTTNFKTRLQARGYQHNLIEKITSEIKFTERKSALQQNEKVRNKILPFFTTYHPAREILKEPPTYLLPKRKIFKRYTRESKTTLNEKSLFTPSYTRNLRVVSGLSTLYIRRRNEISVFASSTNKKWLSISIR